MLGQRTESKLSNLWALCDASSVLLRRTGLVKTDIPTDIFEATAKPIIIDAEVGSQEVLEDVKGGIAITTKDSHGLAFAVQAVGGQDCRSLRHNGKA